MLFGSPKRQIEKYLKKYPTIKVIVVAGSYGRKSAIRALGVVLGQAMTVTIGVNKSVLEDVLILDFNSMAEFPDIKPDVCVITRSNGDPIPAIFARFKWADIFCRPLPPQFSPAGSRSVCGSRRDTARGCRPYCRCRPQLRGNTPSHCRSAPRLQGRIMPADALRKCASPA